MNGYADDVLIDDVASRMRVNTGARIRNAMRRLGCRTVGDVRAMKIDVSRTRNIGRKTEEEFWTIVKQLSGQIPAPDSHVERCLRTLAVNSNRIVLMLDQVVRLMADAQSEKRRDGR